jgi:hypothetical protein
VLGPFATYTKRFLPNVKTVAVVYPNQPGPTRRGSSSARRWSRSATR